METKNQYRRIHLANKMLDGAKALYDFFEELRTNKNSCPHDLAAKLAESYDLTSNQRAVFERVSMRASRAQGIIKYLEDRFSLNSRGEFADAQGLYSILYRTKNRPKDLSAFSYNIAIGFIKGRWLKRKVLGFVNGSSPVIFDQLRVTLEQTISRLEDGKTTACADLSFSMPSLDYLEKFARKRIEEEIPEKRILILILPNEENLAEERNLAGLISKEIEKHELRHIYDNIYDKIVDSRNCFQEFTAGLYGVNSSIEGLNSGLEKDLRNFLDIYGPKHYKDRILRLKKFDAPVIIIKSAEKILEERKKLKQRIIAEVLSLSDLIMKFPKKEYPIISYILSTNCGYTGKLSHRLELLAEAYSQRGNKSQI